VLGQQSVVAAQIVIPVGNGVHTQLLLWGVFTEVVYGVAHTVFRIAATTLVGHLLGRINLCLGGVVALDILSVIHIAYTTSLRMSPMAN
jgi:predicted membrane protein